MQQASAQPNQWAPRGKSLGRCRISTTLVKALLTVRHYAGVTLQTSISSEQSQLLTETQLKTKISDTVLTTEVLPHCSKSHAQHNAGLIVKERKE